MSAHLPADPSPSPPAPERAPRSGPAGDPFAVPGSLFLRLRDAAAADWRGYVRHPFVLALADGTLPADAFRRFLVQDALYLLQYARALSLAVVKAGTLAEMRGAAEAVRVLLHDELALHLRFCRDWGLDEDTLLREPPTLETLAYGGFVMDRAQTGDALDLQATLTACLVGYAEVGERIAADPAAAAADHPYRAWIDAYAGAGYRRVALDGIARLDALAARLGAEARFGALLDQFRTAIRLERAFWSGALRDG